MGRTPTLAAAVLLALTPALPADDKEKAPTVVGKYDCAGEDGSGAKYEGTVKITKTGDAYSVEWDLGAGGTYVGVGLLTDRTLSVSWLSQGRAGVMVYTVGKDGTLSGKWAILGDPKGQVWKETLTKKVT